MVARQHKRILVVVNIHIDAETNADAEEYIRKNFVNQVFKAPIDGPDGQPLIVEIDEVWQ